MAVPVNTHRPGVGDSVRIGGEVALGIAPGERWARVVGLYHRLPANSTFRGALILVRVFQPGDTDFPTGEYRRASTMAICPIRTHTPPFSWEPA